MTPPCQVAAARPRWVGGATCSRSERADTVNMALPVPPAARSARKSGKLVARPASPVVTATTSRPVATRTHRQAGGDPQPLAPPLDECSAAERGDEAEERERADREADSGGA